MHIEAAEEPKAKSESEKPEKSDTGSETSYVDWFSDRMSHWAGGAESVTKIGLLALGLLYVLGLFVSNEYLGRIGLSDFSLLRIKCVLTGAWTLLLLLIGAAPAFLASLYVERQGGEITGIKKNLRFVLCCAVGIVLAAALEARVVEFLTYWPIGSTAMPRGGDARSEIGRSLFRAAVWVVGPLNLPLVFLCWPYFRREKAFRSVTILLGPLVLLVGISDISGQFYPVIGEEMGGGRGRKVTLVLNDEGSKFWRQVNEKASYGSTFATTDQVKLIYQNDSTIVIQDLQEHILFLDRKLVAGVLPVQSDLNERK